MSHSFGPITTTVVGSYPQPNWLIDRAKLGSKVPRIRAPEIWRVPPEFLAEAQNDATRLAIRDMEQAGIDIITDGEMRRESYSNRFATALDGVDIDTPGTIVNRVGKRSVVPRIDLRDRDIRLRSPSSRTDSRRCTSGRYSRVRLRQRRRPRRGSTWP